MVRKTIRNALGKVKPKNNILFLLVAILMVSIYKKAKDGGQVIVIAQRLPRLLQPRFVTRQTALLPGRAGGERYPINSH
jgi:hypothetical protein